MVFYYKDNNNMNIFETYFRSLITQAQGLTRKLKDKDGLDGVDPISIYGEMPVHLQRQHNLIDLLRDEFTQQINLIFVDDKSFVQAFIMKYEDRQNIYISKNNACWARLYACKELSQMLLYSEENATHTIDDIDELLSSLMSSNMDTSSNNHQITTDNITYFGAIEFLLPSDTIAALLAKKKKGASNNEIAKKMLVPEAIVDFRLSNNGIKLFEDILKK